MITVEEIKAMCDCANCPFSKEGSPPHKPVLGEFNEKAECIIVGEGPGEEEARQGRPFVGTTGRELDRQLERAGLHRHKAILLNATACKPPPGKTDQQLGRATKCCAELFKQQLGKAQQGRTLPKLAMGKWAAYAVSGKAQATETARGFIREDSLLITYHPTYAFFRNPWCKGDFLIDLNRFRLLIDGKLEGEPIVITEPSIAHLHSLLSSIRSNNNSVAVDIETGPEDGDAGGYTGKDPTRASLKTIALGTNEYACAFRWPITNGMWSIVSAILIDPKITKVFHNGYMFDLRILKRYGIDVSPTSDTREIRRALCSTSALSLRYLAQTYINGFPDWKAMDKEDEK